MINGPVGLASDMFEIVYIRPLKLAGRAWLIHLDLFLKKIYYPNPQL